MFIRYLRRYPTTLAFLILMATLYSSQLLVAGSLEAEAGFRTINALPQIGVIYASPWLHSTHSHIFQNALIFAIFGGWAERRMDANQFMVAVVVAGYATNIVPSVLGFRGFGVGASGITNALVAYFTLVQISEYAKITQKESLDRRKAVRHLALFAVGLILVLVPVAKFIGYITTQPGTATGGHALGVVLGFSLFILQESQITIRPAFLKGSSQ